MFTYLSGPRILRAPETEDGASPPPAVEQGGDGGAAEPVPPPAEGEGGAEGTPPPSSILDFAPKGEPKGGEAWKLPEGVEVPGHLLGSDAEDTVRKLATAYRGARQELSTRKRDDGVLDGAVPKDLDGYTFESETPDDPVVKDLTSEESKPIVDAWRKAALEVGIPDAAFSTFMQQGIRNMQAEGLQITGNPEEAARINGEAEMEMLTKQLGPAGAEQALRQIDTFAQKLAGLGVIRGKEDVVEFGQMVGTAEGLQLMQRLISVFVGEQPIPPADAVDGAPTVDQAYQMQREALSMPPGSDREDAVARADAALTKAMAEASTPGQIRSRVL